MEKMMTQSTKDSPVAIGCDEDALNSIAFCIDRCEQIQKPETETMNSIMDRTSRHVTRRVTIKDARAHAHHMLFHLRELLEYMEK